jgi:hypothetical protein
MDGRADEQLGFLSLPYISISTNPPSRARTEYRSSSANEKVNLIRLERPSAFEYW